MNSPASLVDDLMAQLQGAPLQQMAQQLGTSPAQAQDACPGRTAPAVLRAAVHRADQERSPCTTVG
ncbi:MAG: hypothetical protein HUU13_10445 [Burkholderiaceae bacterium]|nr:hypothetical protein [Burkholderiaceae bacterium]